MDSMVSNARRLWWGIAAVAIAAVVAVVWYSALPPTTLPAEFTERRAKASSLLAERNAIADVDIRPLIELESKKDYAAAMQLLDAALAANAAQAETSIRLIALSSDLVQLSSRIASPLAAAKAERAFKALGEFASTSAKYHADRERLFILTRQYYQDLLDGKSPEIPAELPALADTATAELRQSIEISDRLRQYLQEFDDLFVESK